MKRQKIIEYQEFENSQDLSDIQADLLDHARKHLSNSYSPYSNFKVSVSLLLEDGRILNGTNQENMAYPSGLCAERVAFFNAGSNFKGIKIKKVAITATTDSIDLNHPITPCGSCRQVMLEYEVNQKDNIEVILQGESGKTFVLEKIRDLVPLHFNEQHLKE